MSRVIRLPQGIRIDYDNLTDEQREKVDAELAEWEQILRRNPLWGFEPFPKQQSFLAAGRVKHKLALAGNRAGKTEIGVVDDLIQCCDAECLPPWLREHKCWEPPFALRVVTMDLNSTLFGVMIPKWQKLTPREQLLGDAWDAAFDKTLRILRFKNGSTVQFMSADQDREKHSGATLDRVHFDEEPPPPNGEGIYDENRRRLIDRRGQVMFTMTPLLGLSWTYDRIWEHRDEPGFRVVQWSMLDNPHLPRDEVQAEIAATKSEKEREAVIFGNFVHFRGRVLEEWDDDRHLIDPLSRDDLKGLDVLVGLDPGVRRGGVVWIAFDDGGQATVFDELYPESTAVAYPDELNPQLVAMGHIPPPDPDRKPSIVRQIREKNRFWGVDPLAIVIDPAAKARSATESSEQVTVESFLIQAGFGVLKGQNNRQVGILDMKGRLENDMLRVSRSCTNWLRERDRWLVANDEEALELRAKGQAKGSTFTTIGPDHLMDPTRYVLLVRAWTPVSEAQVNKVLEWQPGNAPAIGDLTQPLAVGPLGSMS